MTLQANQLQHFTLAINRGRKVKVRREVLEGKTYLVASAAILPREGVVPGSAGALFYPANEVSHPGAIASWNHKPIVLDHPELNGKPVSACDPGIIESRKLGMMLNTRVEGKKLRTDCYFDDSKIDKIEPRIRVALDKSLPMELSTGVFTDNEDKAGAFGGENYTAIARNLRGDHLAMLPDKIGAYSITAGGGLNVNAAADAADAGRSLFDLADNVQQQVMAALAVNEMSFLNITCALNDALRGKFGEPGVEWYGHVEDVFPEFFVYRHQGKLWRLGYVVADDAVTLADAAPEEVTRVTEYRTAGGAVVANANPPTPTPGPAKEPPMPVAKEKVSALLALNCGWEEKHRPVLEAMEAEPFEVLEKQAIAANAKPAPSPAPTAGTPAPQATTAPPALSIKDQTAAYLAAAPEPIRALLNNGLAAFTTEQERLIGVITANSKRFTREFLAAKELGELEAIAEPYLLAAATAATATAPPSYRGAAGAPIGNAAQTVVKPLERPAYTWGKN